MALELISAAFAAVVLVYVISKKLGFSAQSPQDYNATSPAFDLRKHLSGPILCEGIIYGPMGRVNSRFVADMNGVWDRATGTLTESFHYSSGNTQLRKWNLTIGNDGSFRATADDVIGTADGIQSGATVRMRYRIRLPEDAGGHVLNVTDWMYLMENGSILNKSEMRKFGVKVAELVATMRPANALNV
ncbi:DUF3833 domain-containing protein [Pseudohalocynthiibacter aestuariivivens]|jgi:Protein of unknown function (DUF3833)|uniref:DUF3833 domain-containing protein n=1 Tax=Pseudohalocynthiibacter aestuariivivens TaxID=1591409 RepID=A0ABV5JFG8_9RHOB|nr:MULTISPECIES: DUF3833 domain-containing protein [Pseudohalocynthiibacter]MBS9716458.1 DUF3833 domain-containing protein [Pseudohalocynthiibacter aestuariivivens]MCK0100733.1 DUF3833 domain-containing protein [Pseudohalocynthiibacter sp. F2068]